MPSPVRSTAPLLALACVLAVAAVLVAGTAAAQPAPQVTAAKTWKYSGSGPKKLGTVKLRRVATLRWRSSGRLLQITDSHGFRLLYTKARRGKLRIRRGTYSKLTLSTRGSWRITIRERR
jgi:hypothetical protein